MAVLGDAKVYKELTPHQSLHLCLVFGFISVCVLSFVSVVRRIYDKYDDWRDSKTPFEQVVTVKELIQESEAAKAAKAAKASNAKAAEASKTEKAPKPAETTLWEELPFQFVQFELVVPKPEPPVVKSAFPNLKPRYPDPNSDCGRKLFYPPRNIFADI